MIKKIWIDGEPYCTAEATTCNGKGRKATYIKEYDGNWEFCCQEHYEHFFDEF